MYAKKTCVSSGCRSHVAFAGTTTGHMQVASHARKTCGAVCAGRASKRRMIWYSPTTSSRHSRSRRTICAVSSSLVQALLRLSRRKFGGKLAASAAWSAARNVRVLAMRTCGKRACNVGTSHTNATCEICPRPASRKILHGCLVPLRYKHVALAAALEEANSSLVHVHAE